MPIKCQVFENNPIPKKLAYYWTNIKIYLSWSKEKYLQNNNANIVMMLLRVPCGCLQKGWRQSGPGHCSC